MPPLITPLELPYGTSVQLENKKN